VIGTAGVVVAVFVAVVGVEGALGSVTELGLDGHAFVIAAIFVLVSGPTELMPFALWKAATAFCVTAPK